MPPLTLFLAKLIGATMVVAAMWMAHRKDAVLALMRRIVDDEAAIAYIGMVRLTLGLAMVIGHDVWSGGALPVIVTAIGWLTLLRGLFMLFAPHETIRRAYEALGFERRFAAWAGGVGLFGLYLLIAGYIG